jgi:hypothetical protein
MSTYETSRTVCQMRALAILARIARGETVSQEERDAHNVLCDQIDRA